MDERRLIGIKAICFQGHEVFDENPSIHGYGYEEYNGIAVDIEVTLECPICKAENYKDYWFSINV